MQETCRAGYYSETCLCNLQKVNKAGCGILAAGPQGSRFDLKEVTTALWELPDWYCRKAEMLRFQETSFCTASVAATDLSAQHNWASQQVIRVDMRKTCESLADHLPSLLEIFVFTKVLITRFCHTFSDP